MNNKVTKKTRNKQRKKLTNCCDICNKTIRGGSYNFKSHLYSHQAVKARFCCQYCSKSYFRQDLYRRHVNKHENIVTHKKVFICDYCDRSFTDKRNLISHLRIHDDSVKVFQHFCHVCNIHFSENRTLVNHIRRKHFSHEVKEEPLYLKRKVNESWLELVNDSDVYVQITKLHENIISIKKCGTIKRDSSTDIKPIKKENPKKKSYTFLETEKYTLFSKAICDYCNKEMLKKSIQNHIRERHLNIRRFSCGKCNRTFKRRYQVAHHPCEKPIRKRANAKAQLIKPSNLNITVDQ